MAGQKGRSGGKREGAGRKVEKIEIELSQQGKLDLDWLYKNVPGFSPLRLIGAVNNELADLVDWYKANGDTQENLERMMKEGPF